MFPMTVTIHNMVQLQAFIATLGDGMKAISDAKGNKDDDNARQALQDKRDVKAKDKPISDGTIISPETQAEIERVKASNAAKTKPEAIDYEKQIKPAVLTLAAHRGRDALLSVLVRFDSSENPNAKNVKPEQYADLLKALQDAVA